ncbi:MAG: anti-anti-sigma factor [Methylophaga sp.]|nr:MAG: anti-anti-sigma factor [Methylophaga sp.]
MSITTKTEGNIHTIKIQGRLDFNVQSEFRSAYESVVGSSKFILDMTSVEYMDSSALGMLLLLRDHAGGGRATIELHHCRSEVKSILEIANFQKLFVILD